MNRELASRCAAVKAEAAKFDPSDPETLKNQLNEIWPRLKMLDDTLRDELRERCREKAREIFTEMLTRGLRFERVSVDGFCFVVKKDALGTQVIDKDKYPDDIPF